MGQICTGMTEAFQVGRLKLLPKGVENTCRQRSSSSRSWLSLKSAMSGLKKKKQQKIGIRGGEDCSEIRVSSVPTSRQGAVGWWGGGWRRVKCPEIARS